jgi:hypothetical protein
MTDMVVWQGVQRQESFDNPNGALFLQNARFYIEGELARRHGLLLNTAQSGTVANNFYNPVTGRFSIYFSNGNLVALPQ